jgi:hypothetical protein
VKYLESKLEEWKSSGHVTAGSLETLIPSADRIEAGVKSLKDRVATKSPESEIHLLHRALQVELETGAFYKSMVNELPAEAKPLFRRFVEIEEGHEKIVQAEIDSVSGLGWFDIQNSTSRPADDRRRRAADIPEFRYYRSGLKSKNPILVRRILQCFLRCFPFPNDQITFETKNVDNGPLTSRREFHLSMDCDKLAILEDAQRLIGFAGELLCVFLHACKKRFAVAFEIRVVMAKIRVDILVLRFPDLP